MAPIEVTTSLGPIWFWGPDTGQPLVLLITGLFAERDLWDLDRSLLPPGFDYLRAHLPGNHCPTIEDLSIAGFGRAFSEAIAARFGERAMLLAGFSAGALVALSVEAPNVRRLFLVEPPLRTHDLWPARRWAGQALTDVERACLRNVLGIDREATVPRDYTDLLAGLRVPADVVLGSQPLLPERPLKATPSLVDAPSRALLAAHPLVRIGVVEGAGHNVTGHDGRLVARALIAAARKAFGLPA